MFMEIGRTAYPDSGRQNAQGNTSKGRVILPQVSGGLK